MTLKGTPKGIKESLEPDGSLLLQIMLENGDVLEVAFDQTGAQFLVQLVQEALMERAAKTIEPFGVAPVQLHGSGAGTGILGPAVQVSMDKIGLVSLIASDSQLLKLRQDIDRALEMRGERKRAN